ncbi:hypothetical protein BKA63DRAFT_481904 [Paraphoma chrysanthemicola]|nr:hypothetical protein BKA63DRAFT_481904 [Paraphoma chrysanthemicola]
MCNIVTFRFTCQHTLRRRRSRCNGTKHKITASSIKAACIAESFLTIYLRVDCGPCQHTAWDEGWRRKLERATEFLEKLRQRNMPGEMEVERLVRELEAEYASASWDTQNVFAPAIKRSVGRVKHTWRERATSPLPREVFPDDVVETVKREWSEMEEHEYDGNYVASTDPIHPISTDYSHPLDDDDGSWVLQHLSSEDVQATSDDTDIDFNQGSHWTWNDDSHQPQTPAPSSDEVSNSEARTTQILQRKQTDLTKFYADWLYICRCEMRDFEGVGGRLISEPDGIRGR